jgi:hypothetical protein
MANPSNLPNTLTVLFGFGGSGGKTIAALAELVTSDPQAAELAKHRLHVVLCDTDESDLRKSEGDIKAAFATRCPGLQMQVEKFSLSSNVDAFCDLVEQRIGDSKVSPEGKRRIREHWWFNQHDDPFSATRLPLPPNAGAGQCPLVSHFLAWDKLDQFPAVLDKIDAYARNERHMEDYAVDLILVSSLAGGTGRGCWQTLSLKAREHFGRRGQACRPYGFFMDQAVFDDVQRGRPEQKIKLRVNSLTGLSELAMWLRSDTRLDGESDGKNQPRERRYSLPNLAAPEATDSDVLDTERYMPESERSRVGRSPIHKAYVFTNESSCMVLGSANEVYKACANAVYGRIMIGQLRSDDANQPARAAATATSILYTPVTDIRMVVQAKARAARVRSMLEGRVSGKPVVEFRQAAAGVVEAAVSNDAIRQRLDRMAARVQAFLTVHERDTRDPQVTESSPHASFLRRRKDNASRTANFDDVFRRGDAKAFELRLNNYAKPSADLGASLQQDIQRVLALDAGEQERLSKASTPTSPESQARVIAELAIRKLVLAPSDIDSGLPSFGFGEAGCIGLVVAGIERLHQALKEQSDALSNARKESETRKSGAGIDAVLEAFKKNRSRIPLVPKFSKTGRENVIGMALLAKEAAERPAALAEFSAIAAEMLSIVEEWRANARVVVEIMRNAAKSEERKVEQQLDLCFTVENPARSKRANAEAALQQLINDDRNPVTRIRRMVRPLFDQKAFDYIVQETLGELGGTAAAQEMLIEQLVGGKRGDQITERSILFSRERRSSDRYRFQQSVEAELLSILGKQGTPSNAMHKFALPSVLERLAEHWCTVYTDNLGDEAFCQSLATAVQRLCGLDLVALRRRQEADKSRLGTEALEPPTLEEIISAAALQLARKCDPLIRYPSDRNGSGDLVTILLPDVSFGSGNKPWESWVNRINDDWRSMPAEFAFVKSDRNVGNPYMMVAVSDHPKRDFDHRGWSGWISFDYWSDPTLAFWMRAIEDSDGASVFAEGVDDSIGLGYLDPSVVKTSHWARRRWRPWFDPTREKTQDRRKWEALAYALLGNDLRTPDGKPVSESQYPFVRRYRDFITAFEKHVVPNSNFPSETWTLPVIEERHGDKQPPKFTRALFKSGADGLRWDSGLPVDKFGSMRNFVEWFKSEESGPVLEKLWAEQVHFARLVASAATSKDTTAIHDVSSDAHRQDIRLSLAEYVRLWIQAIETNVTREDDRTQQVAFLEEFAQLFRPDFDLLRPFDAASPTA